MGKAAESEFKRFKKETEAKAKDDEVEVTPLDFAGLFAVKEAMDQMDKVFGIFYEVPDVSGVESQASTEDDSEIPAEVVALVEERTAAKDAKDWSSADSLRDRIKELGFAIKDVKGG